MVTHMSRKRRSKRHIKRSIKRYNKHVKTRMRIRRNMYRKKHKKTQRGGMFGFTSDKIQEELAACKEELAISKNLYKESHDVYRNQIQDREFFYKNKIDNLEAELLACSRRFHDVEIELKNKLSHMTRAYDHCMAKYDSDTVKYNEAKKKIIEEAGPGEKLKQGYYFDEEDLAKVVRSYMEHNDLETAVTEYKNRPKHFSQAFGPLH